MFIDLFFLAVIVYGFYLGYSKGLFRVIFIFLLMSFAVMVSMLLMPLTVELLHSAFDVNNKMMPYFAFFLTMIIFFFFIWIVTNIISENYQSKNLTIYGKGFAGFFMATFLLFIYSGMIGFLSDSRLLKYESINKQSMTYAYILKIESFGVQLLKYTMPFSSKFFEYVNDSSQRLDSIDKKSKDK
jgi:hypothetical protein